MALARQVYIGMFMLDDYEVAAVVEHVQGVRSNHISQKTAHCSLNGTNPVAG
jgi:hypothetical protein